jgi:DNA repair ATPase RecN
MLDAVRGNEGGVGGGEANAYGCLWTRVRETQIQYRDCRAERNRIQNDLENRVLPARYESSMFGEAGDSSRTGIDQDAELVTYWVQELDQFERKVLSFCSLLADLSPIHADDDDLYQDGNRNEENGVRLSRLARDIASMKWTETTSVSRAAPTSTLSREGRTRVAGRGTTSLLVGGASSALWEGLMSYRDALSNLERQISDARTARDLVGSIACKDSAITAIERARDLLGSYPQQTRHTVAAKAPRVRESFSASGSERAQNALYAIEDAIVDFCRCLDDDTGLIPGLERELSQSRVSKDDVESLLLAWGGLARKHGISPTVLPSCHAALRAELSGSVRALSLLPAAIAEEEAALQAFEAACTDISRHRADAAARLSTAVTSRLSSLGMDQGVFEARLNPQAKKCTDAGVYNAPSGSTIGLDSVEFILGLDRSKTIQTTQERGPANGPVHVVASSGEKARLLLSIECSIPGSVGAACRVLSAPPWSGMSPSPSLSSSVPPVVVLYDEIDAHLGGHAAVAVARMLVDQAERCQVIAITHNPSLAASGDVHIVVQRRNESPRETGARGRPQGSSIFVSAGAMDGHERRIELARMASGDLASNEAAIFADALIRDGSKRKRVNTTALTH